MELIHLISFLILNDWNSFAINDLAERKNLKTELDIRCKNDGK